MRRTASSVSPTNQRALVRASRSSRSGRILPTFSRHTGLAIPAAIDVSACFRRRSGPVFGERFVSLDLDCVITGDCRPLWDRKEDIVFWGDTNPTTVLQRSMILMKAGARPKVWNDLRPDAIAGRGVQRRAVRFRSGLDRSLSRPQEAALDQGGRRLLVSKSHRTRQSAGGRPHRHVPRGITTPWSSDVQARHSWVREHYR
jgi:hypothetical protein